MLLCCDIDHLRCEGRNVMYKHVQFTLHCAAENNLKRDSFSDYTLNNQCRFYQKVCIGCATCSFRYTAFWRSCNVNKKVIEIA